MVSFISILFSKFCFFSVILVMPRSLPHEGRDDRVEVMVDRETNPEYTTPACQLMGDAQEGFFLF